ncbi:hypothetical protein FLAVO9R_70167 [Flavobacterium sp. 9R]|nr:hypothetical protein FLAVO9R_70167 [Flavobacterium sp. 9R]
MGLTKTAPITKQTVFTAQILRELFTMNHKTPLVINIKNILGHCKTPIHLQKFSQM